MQSLFSLHNFPISFLELYSKHFIASFITHAAVVNFSCVLSFSISD